ncbi:hypothetical protein [Kitasatospora sp. NPDC127060]|uniref:hypothetical protein n=1 Tax=Kitasatospora sp. NPDC127060 TaxID=3347121 RepID=UPI00366855B0
MPLPRGLRRECEAILATLPIPNPFTVDRFAQALSETRGREIVFEPMEAAVGPNVPSAMWIALKSVDVVLYETKTSLAHQTLIKLHELGHIAAGHQCRIQPEALEAAFPGLDPETVKEHLLLTRAGYDNREEQQAETLALLLADHLGAPDGTSPQGRRLTTTLTHPVRRILAWKQETD